MILRPRKPKKVG